MGKGYKTRLKIIETARSLFAQSGYCAVTMKDICEACGLSRGGLYRYFPSVKEVFLAVLGQDIHADTGAVERAISAGAPAQVIFGHYLDNERDLICSKHRGLFFAIHEFAFAERDQRAYFAERLAQSARLLGMIFSYGQETGAFKQFDIDATATHIIYFFDSMKTSSTVFDMTNKMLDEQIQIIKDMVL